MFTQARHYNICVIVSAQYSSGLLSPAVRSNIDLIFCSRMSEQGLEKIFLAMNDSSINKKDFYKMVDQNYKNHNFVYYHNLNK